MIYAVLCCKVSTERQAYQTKMRDRVWSWHWHNSSILPLKRVKDEEKDRGVREDTAISGLDRGERKEERRGKRKAWFATAYLSASFLYWSESEDWAHHWLSLSSLLFSLFPRLAWRPCNSQLPLQLPWLFFKPVFSAFASACSPYPSLYLTVTYTSRECGNGFLKIWSLRERTDVQRVRANLIDEIEMAYSYKYMFLSGC